MKWKLDSVQDQVFIEVEKNPFLYHNLLALNFNTDLGSKWALKMIYSIKRTFRHYFMVKQSVKKVLRTFLSGDFLEKSYVKVSVDACTSRSSSGLSPERVEGIKATTLAGVR